MKQYKFIFTYELVLKGETVEFEIPFLIRHYDFGEACIKADEFVDETLCNFKTPTSTIRFESVWDLEESK